VHWFRDFLNIDERFVLRHNSFDAYLFLRFWRMIILICFVGCCLTWPILMPANWMGGGDATQLDRLTFSNVESPKIVYLHAIVAWLFIGM